MHSIHFAFSVNWNYNSLVRFTFACQFFFVLFFSFSLCDNWFALRFNRNFTFQFNDGTFPSWSLLVQLFVTAFYLLVLLFILFHAFRVWFISFSKFVHCMTISVFAVTRTVHGRKKKSNEINNCHAISCTIALRSDGSMIQLSLACFYFYFILVILIFSLFRHANSE